LKSGNERIRRSADAKATLHSLTEGVILRILAMEAVRSVAAVEVAWDEGEIIFCIAVSLSKA
jgi:hypothetical protein